MPRRSNADKIAALENQIISLKSQNEALKQNSEALDRAAPTPKAPDLTPEQFSAAMKAMPMMAPAGPGDVPGSYKLTGRDPQGNPVYTKVPWTRGTIEQYFGPVEFESLRSETVLFDGVRYQIVEGTNRVPSIIRDIYLQAERAKKAQTFPPLSMGEEHRNIQDATMNKVAMTRPFFIGTGPLGPEAGE